MLAGNLRIEESKHLSLTDQLRSLTNELSLAKKNADKVVKLIAAKSKDEEKKDGKCPCEKEKPKA